MQVEGAAPMGAARSWEDFEGVIDINILQHMKDCYRAPLPIQASQFRIKLSQSPGSLIRLGRTMVLKEK